MKLSLGSAICSLTIPFARNPMRTARCYNRNRPCWVPHSARGESHSAGAWRPLVGNPDGRTVPFFNHSSSQFFQSLDLLISVPARLQTLNLEVDLAPKPRVERWKDAVETNLENDTFKMPVSVVSRTSWVRFVTGVFHPAA